MAVRSPSISDILKEHFCDYEFDYFNAGVLLIYLEAIGKNNFGKLFLTEALKGYKCQDQDVLNLVCKGIIIYLHPSYNCHTCIQNHKMEGYYDSIEVDDALSDPSIFHWNGKKPWDDCINADCSNLWWNKYGELSKLIDL